MTPVMNIAEFEKLSEPEQRELFIEWRDHLKNAQLMRAMGIDAYKYNILRKKLDVPRKKGRKQLEREMREQQKMEVAVTVEEEKVVPKKTTKLDTKYSGTLSVIASPDIMIYLKSVPELEVPIERIGGYELKGVIVCTNPNSTSEVDAIAKSLNVNEVRKTFGNGSLITALYKRLEV